MPRRNPVVVEPLVDPPGLNRGLRRESDAVEKYFATETEVRWEEEPKKFPNEAEGRPPVERMVVEPVMESGTTDVGRPVRVRKPPIRFAIDEFVRVFRKLCHPAHWCLINN